MCVILEKLPGKEIPYEHLLAGAHRNPHGWGVVIGGGGELKKSQGLGEPEKAATAVAEELAKAKDATCFVHFRYKTVGEVTLANTHPITILSKAEDGVDIQFLHNGTITGFAGHSTGPSDSVQFAARVLAPLARRSARYLGPEEVTADPLLADILYRYSEGCSKFVLFDSNGQSLVIGRKSGADQDYGWASNAYSLSPANIPRPKEEKTTSTVHRGARFAKGDSHQELVERLMISAKQGDDNTETCAPSVRLTCQEICGLKPKAFTKLDPEQIRTMIEEEPDFSTILILDLLYELYNQDFQQRKVA